MCLEHAYTLSHRTTVALSSALELDNLLLERGNFRRPRCSITLTRFGAALQRRDVVRQFGIPLLPREKLLCEETVGALRWSAQERLVGWESVCGCVCALP